MLKGPDRERLHRYFDRHEDIKFFESLFRDVGELLPDQILAILYNQLASDGKLETLSGIINDLEDYDKPQDPITNIFDSIVFDENGKHSPTIGQVSFSGDSLEIEQTNIIQRVGQSLYVVATNNTGSDIAKGEAVSYIGITADVLNIEIYNGSNYIGVAAEDIADGEFGYIAKLGYVSGVDTSAFTVGDYVVNEGLKIAIVVTSDTDGLIFVQDSGRTNDIAFFISTDTQTLKTANSAQNIAYDNTPIGSGIDFIDVQQTGVITRFGLDEGEYLFESTHQIKSDALVKTDFWAWYRIDGVNIPNSAVKINFFDGMSSVSHSSKYTALADNERLQVMWAASEIESEIEASIATAFAPETPSSTLKVTRL